MRTIIVSLIYLLSLGFLTACGEKETSYSLLPDQDVFEQSAKEVSGKIDILWVIDNSGSMETSQQNVADNFQSFIEQFQTKGFDFNIAVTTSEAYLDYFQSEIDYSRFRDGTDFTEHTGVTIINKDTPDLSDTFITNILQGISGNGDERVFQSMRAALENQDNLDEGFPREDSFLAVIIVSDEDDFSHDGSNFLGGQYSNPDLHSHLDYVSFLDGITNSSPGRQNYSVNAIGIWDEDCRLELTDLWPGRKIGYRMGDLVDATEGVKGSLCDDFAGTLEAISASIITLTTQFYMSRVPVESTIEIIVDGVEVPKSSENGWSYDEIKNAIIFSGDYIPAAGAEIIVKFDPVTIKE